MANLDGSGLSEVWVRAAQLVKRFTGAVNLTKGDLQTQVDTKITGTAISSSSAITTQGEYALDAREKNASVEGTLANQISTLNSNLQSKADKDQIVTKPIVKYLDNNGIHDTLEDCTAPFSLSYNANSKGQRSTQHYHSKHFGFSLFEFISLDDSLLDNCNVSILHGLGNDGRLYINFYAKTDDAIDIQEAYIIKMVKMQSIYESENQNFSVANISIGDVIYENEIDVSSLGYIPISAQVIWLTDSSYCMPISELVGNKLKVKLIAARNVGSSGGLNSLYYRVVYK